MEHKLKQAIIHLYTRQGGNDWTQLGRAIDWRIQAAWKLAQSVNRGRLSFHDFTAAVAGLTIQRQIEDELDQYQQDLQELSGQLRTGDIDDGEFTDRLEQLTAAILLIALLRGSSSEGEAATLVLTAAVQVLDSAADDEAAAGIIADEDALLAAIPDEAARNELDSELAIASVSAAGLAADLLAGTYEDKEDALYSRLAMWATTALGVYAVGQMFRKDDPFLEWVYNPLKDHCDDCVRLNGQVHTASQWSASGWFPKSRGLACSGFKCGCSWVEADGPSKGNF